MATYLVLFFSLTIISFILQLNHVGSRKNRGFAFIFLIIVVLSFTLIQGMRDISIGEDTKVYVSWFKSISDKEAINSKLYDNDIEIGFRFINILVSSITNDYHFFLYFVSLIITLLNTVFLYKYSKNFYISIILFLAFNHFLTSMVSLRQYIAIGIIIWVIPLFWKKRFFSGLLVMVIAAFFHYSSILFSLSFIITYFVSKKKKYFIFIPILLVSAVFLFYPLSSVLVSAFPKYSSYFDGKSGEIGYLDIVFVVIMLLVSVLILKKKNYNINRQFASLFLIAIAMTFIGLKFPYMFRFLYYYKYLLLIAIPYLQPKSKTNATIYFAGIVLISTFLFLYYLSVNPGFTVPYVPYL